ncbi:hypothetical protein WJX84_001601, partial [Apatococcus fuscideae]
MWWLTAAAYLLILLLGYAVLKRAAAAGVSQLLQRSRLQAQIGTLGFLTARRVSLKLTKGPVALVTIDEVSLGRSKSPIKLANKLATQHDGLRFRLPFTVRGVKIVLRRSKLPASSEDVPGAQQDGAALASGHQQQHAKSESIKFGAAVINSALRLLLGILPSIPVRVKQLSIVHEDAGICADISRIEVLINSSRLSSKLQVDLHVSPVTAAWTEDAGLQQQNLRPPPILVLDGLQAAAELQVTSQATGLQPKSVAVETHKLSIALGPEIMRLVPARTHQERPQPQKKPHRRRQLTADKVAARLPEEATFVLPLLEISVMPWSPGKQGAACRQPQSTVRLETLQVRGGRLLRQTSGGCAGPEDAVGPEPLYALGLSIGPLQVKAGDALSDASTAPAAKVLWTAGSEQLPDTQPELQRFQIAWQAELRADDTSKVLLLDGAKDTLLEASWSGFALSCGSQRRQAQGLTLSLADAAVSLRSREFFAESILVTADAEERVSGRLQSYGELQKLIVMQRMEVQMAAAPSELGREAAQELAVTGGLTCCNPSISLHSSLLMSAAQLAAVLVPPPHLIIAFKPAARASEPQLGTRAPDPARKLAKRSLLMKSITVDVTEAMLTMQTAYVIPQHVSDRHAKLLLFSMHERAQQLGSGEQLSTRRSDLMDFQIRDILAGLRPTASMPARTQSGAPAFHAAGQPDPVVIDHNPFSESFGRPSGLGIVLDCSLRGIEVKLPWDQDPGAAIRFTELWAKAFKQALQEHIQELSSLKPSSHPGKPRPPSSTRLQLFPLELRLNAQDLLVKFEMHPME